MQTSKTTIVGGIVAVILLFSGIALATGIGETSSDTLLDTTSSSIAQGSSSTSLDSNSSSTSLDDNGSLTSLGDAGSTSSTLDDSSTTSTTIVDNTTSTVDDDNSTTSTTVDDDTTSTVDDNGSGSIEDGARSFSVDGVAVVTVNVVGGQLRLIGVNLQSGWVAEIEKERSDRIEIEFSNGDQEAEFEVRLDNGRLRVETEVKD